MKPVSLIVTGADGQLGRVLQEVVKQYTLITPTFLSRKEMDITDQRSVMETLAKAQSDYIIHAAAYTAVDKAESEADVCFSVNRDGSRNIARALSGSQSKLIYISSDYVYNTYNGFPLKENDPVNPSGVYAQSKLAGETAILEEGIPALIVRTSWVVSHFGHNFVKTMVRLGNEKQEIRVVNDQFGSITSAADLAKSLLNIIIQDAQSDLANEKFKGIYNFSNEGCITWYDIACRIMDACQLSCRVIPITTAEFTSAAPRPPWSVLSKRKIKESWNIDVPHWVSALDEILMALHSPV